MARNELSEMATATTETLHDSSLDTKARRWINETIQDIHARSKMIYLHKTGTLTMVVDQQEYQFTSIGSDIDKILYVRDQNNSIALQEITYANLYDIVSDMTNAASGNPTVYYIKNEIIGLYPIPDSTDSLDIDYKKRSTDLTADTDTPDIPIEWTDVILLGAEAKGLRYLKRSDWTTTQQFYESEVRRRLANNLNRPNLRFQMKEQSIETSLFTPRLPPNF